MGVSRFQKLKLPSRSPSIKRVQARTDSPIGECRRLAGHLQPEIAIGLRKGSAQASFRGSSFLFCCEVLDVTDGRVAYARRIWSYAAPSQGQNAVPGGGGLFSGC